MGATPERNTQCSQKPPTSATLPHRPRPYPVPWTAAHRALSRAAPPLWTWSKLRNNISCMKCDSRLSSVLHMLLHLAQQQPPRTSHHLAAWLDTNPVVVRRELAGLRQQGIVESARGHGGGWTLARRLESITVHDIHRALGGPSPFAIGHRRSHPACPVEQIVNEAVDEGLRAAEDALHARFARTTLADLAATARRRSAARTIAEHRHDS